jgi:Sec-independent protein translocase protein TatA
MSDNVLTILIICIMVVIVLIIFRNKLKSISVKVKEWIFEMKTHETPATGAEKKFEKRDSDANISLSVNGNKIRGENIVIDASINKSK